MGAQDRAIQKLAKELAGIRREVTSWRGPQLDYSSIENSGNITFKDGDGNVTAVAGGQDDGSNTIRHVDGPTPPIPSGLSAHVDGPIIQVSWDGTFEDADSATFDWSHLEVVVVGPSNEQLTATINDITGASTSVAATASGEWDVYARSVSRAEKRSLDGDAGTVDVELVGLTGAINDAIGSANGKNTVTYAEVAPTPADEGIAGDTWFVGSVADIPNPNNLAQNPDFNTLQYQRSDGMANASTGTSIDLSTDWFSSKPKSLKITPSGSANTTAVDQIQREYAPTGADAGKTYTIAADFHLEEAQSGSEWLHARRILVRARYDGLTSTSWRRSDAAPNAPGTTRLVVTFTLPPGLEWWYFLLVNGSSTTPVYWDNLTIEEGVTDGEYWVTNEDGAWNVVEQYRHNGTSWFPVELNHEVISSVDLGKATVGELDGIRIQARTISGESFTGDAFDGIVFRGNTFVTRDGNGELSDSGLFFRKPDGTAIMRVPTDGSPMSFSASDTQIQRAQVDELELNYGSVRSGGELTLSAGVTPPASPPKLNSAWQRVATLEQPTPGVSHGWLGLAAWGDKWVRAVNAHGGEYDHLDSLEIYNPDGTLNRNLPIGLNPRAGVAVVGDVAYTLGQEHVVNGDNFVDGYDLNTGERVTRWKFTRFDAPNQAQLALGSSGGNIHVAGVHMTAGTVYVLTYDPATGAQVGPDAIGDWDVIYTKDLVGVHVAGSDVYISHRTNVRAYERSGGVLTRTFGLAWENPNKDATGITDNPSDALFYVVDGGGAVYRSGFLSGDQAIEACYTWHDGTHETTPSPISSMTLPSYQTLTATVQEREGLQRRVYFKIGNAWARKEAGETGTAVTLTAAGMTPADPPDENTFPASTPATLKSSIGGFEVKGDGSGSWGPLEFHADGTMAQTAPAWTAVTSFNSGFSAHTFGYAPAYRIWPDGKVEWRGVIGGTFNATAGVDPFTLPPATRPAQAVNFQIATQGSIGGRAEFGPTDATTVLRIYTSSSRPFAMLDGCYYYTT